MFKAKFVNYKKTASGDIGIFTPGRYYELEVIENNSYYRTIDDYGMEVKFSTLNSDLYEFEGFYRSYLNAEDIDEPASLKYFINGNLVTKDYFYETISEVNKASRFGVNASSVNFEIKFE